MPLTGTSLLSRGTLFGNGACRNQKRLSNPPEKLLVDKIFDHWG
jgi:hypothetical protein